MLSKIHDEKRFERWLYRNYRYATSVGTFITERINPPAWLLIGCTGGSLILGANWSRSIVVVLTFLFCSVLFVGLVWALFRKVEVVVVREVPRTGAVGEPLPYVAKVQNLKSSALRDLFLKEGGNDSRPSEWEFCYLEEPGEEDRNIFDRKLAFYRWKWLLQRGGQWRGGESLGVDLDPDESKEVSMTLFPLRRGLIRLNDMRAVLPDPFGLFQRRSAILNEESEVLIIPKRYRLPNVVLDGESELKTSGEAASTVRGEGDEFLGLREYRSGDSLRRIHWKAWARTGRPIVKQFEDNRFPRYGLVLDTSLKESGKDHLEEAISVAASFVSTLDQQDCLLDMMFVRGESQVFMSERGEAQTERLMEVLAEVQGSEEGGYESLEQLVLQHRGEMAACVVVLSGWNKEREVFLAKIRAAGVTMHVYVVGVGEQPDDDALAEAHWLRWDHVQEDLLT